MFLNDRAPVTALPSRRDVLRAGGALGAVAGLGVSRARGAGAARVLKMGYLFVHDSQLGAGTAEFARRIDAATHGAWRIEEYPNGALGGEVEMLDGLRKGEFDLGFITAAPLSGVVPDFGIFDLPFLFRDASHAHAVLDGPIGQEYLAKFHGHDLVALAWGENGMRHLTNSKQPVHTPQDLHGLRLRVPQSDVTLRCFRQLGVEAASLGFPALYGALEAGRFDGQENPIAVIRASHFDRVQRYLTLTGHQYGAAIIFMSKDAWDDLSPVKRDAFVQAARAGGVVSRQVAGQAERDGIEALQAGGMEVVRDVDRAAFLAALEPTWSEYATQFGEARIARMRAQT